jgi:hypothetical protein
MRKDKNNWTYTTTALYCRNGLNEEELRRKEKQEEKPSDRESNLRRAIFRRDNLVEERLIENG